MKESEIRTFADRLIIPRAQMTNQEALKLWEDGKRTSVFLGRWICTHPDDESPYYVILKNARRENISKILSPILIGYFGALMLMCVFFLFDIYLFKIGFQEWLSSAISNHVLIFSLMVAILVVGAIIMCRLNPLSLSAQVSFIVFLEQFSEMAGKPIGSLPDSEADLRQLGNEMLVERAYQVLRIEADNEEVPREHWENEARVARDKFTFCYEILSTMGISGGPYGKFYTKARKKLRNLGVELRQE